MDFFTGRLEVVIKFDYETEQLGRKIKALNLSKQSESPSTPPLGGEPSGQLAFVAEMLSLREDGNERWEAERQLQSTQSRTLFPIYHDGEDVKGTVTRAGLLEEIIFTILR